MLGVFKLTAHRAVADATTIKSGFSGYCLDDHLGKLTAGNEVDAWHCNSSGAQTWNVSGLSIRHHGSYCLSVADNVSAAGTPVVLEPCQAAAGQIWLRDKGGYFNPNSTRCLAAPAAGHQLTIEPCASTAAQTWSPSGLNLNSDLQATCSGPIRDKIACYAAFQWTTWQSGATSHENLLGTYTDGAPYEEWCADFVSYVYREAGLPFARAYDGWDENNANNIRADTGFTVHQADSGYVPQTGDIAYFDYDGGHVEIVASGGRVPTFIYGDSATIDLTTGNGQMKANTILSDGAEGRVVYYLSPS
ncbi:MAG TPA: ricin-type beta-trefoil lectin domain protein [Candidatus Saccharimonadales bacterium]